MIRNLIIRVNYENLQNEVHVEYNETIEGIVAKFNPHMLGIAPQYDAYKTALVVEIDALDLIYKSEYTSEISAQDHVRDGIFRGLTDSVKSALNHFHADKRKAAEKVNIAFEHYGNIAAKTFDQETAAIDDLLRELNDNYAAEILLLSLSDWLMQLDFENRTFKQLMSERYAKNAQQRHATSMKPARSETDKALRSLLNMLEALVMVNGVANYEALINELNAVSERYKNQLAQAAGRRKKAGKE
ncbi:MAG: DUF6261 family protein [Prevotellaceae bacterium]|jgi:hypothetical protein|nr:DUF6261 family protein [Prevotellaceae bacterium]